MIRNTFRKAFSGRKNRQDDVLFEQEVIRIHHMQSVSKRLYKDMKKCVDMESGQTKAGYKVINTLHSSQCANIEPLKATIECIDGCTEDLQSHYKDHQLRQDATFTEPMKKFHNLYKHVDVHIKQRESRLQELEKQQLKLEKRQNSQSGKLELTQRKVASAKSEYEKIHQRLMNELPQLYEKRIDLFDPCLTAMMSSQLLYHQECASTLRKSLDFLESTKQSDQSLNDVFAEIKSLSIVGDPDR